MTPILRTYRAGDVNPLQLRPQDVHLETIAHSLALTNRFVGHTSQPISVAQHSVYVSRLLQPHGPQLALIGLIHDMSEAYLGDVSKWVKHSPAMAAYREHEHEAETLIYMTLLHRVPTTEEETLLDWADRVMVRFEGQMGFGPTFLIDHPRYPPLTTDERQAIGDWTFWGWQYAETSFLRRWEYLKARV